MNPTTHTLAFPDIRVAFRGYYYLWGGWEDIPTVLPAVRIITLSRADISKEWFPSTGHEWTAVSCMRYAYANVVDICIWRMLYHNSPWDLPFLLNIVRTLMYVVPARPHYALRMCLLISWLRWKVTFCSCVHGHYWDKLALSCNCSGPSPFAILGMLVV